VFTRKKVSELTPPVSTQMGSTPNTASDVDLRGEGDGDDKSSLGPAVEHDDEAMVRGTKGGMPKPRARGGSGWSVLSAGEDGLIVVGIHASGPWGIQSLKGPLGGMLALLENL